MRNEPTLAAVPASEKRTSEKYARDLAALMGVSEAELCHARVGHEAQPLKPQFRELMLALEAVGETKNITRNAYAVHEHLGHYQNVRLGDHAGLVLNPRALDLRFSLTSGAALSFCASRARAASGRVFRSLTVTATRC